MIKFSLIQTHSVMTPRNKNLQWEYSKENSRTRRKMNAGFAGKGTNKHPIAVTTELKYSKNPSVMLGELVRETNKRMLFQQARRIGLYGKHIGSKPLSRVKAALRNYNIAVASLKTKVA